MLTWRNPGEMIGVKRGVVEAVGNTPLGRLNRVFAGIAPAIAVKAEAMNPGRSVKDRIAVALGEEAERKGLLKRGVTIVEPTSGNTGGAQARSRRT